MANDHFETHSYMENGKVDWNFNILFDDQPQVGEMAKRYAPFLEYPGLYPPIPPEWLHITILRIGFTTDISEAEMQAATQVLAPVLAAMRMPEITLGPAWLYRGYPLLHVTPEEPLDRIFQEVLRALRPVIGEDRMPVPVDRSATKLSPHLTLAYTRTYNTEDKLEKILADNPIPPVNFRPGSVALVKQRPIEAHYEWEVVQKLSLAKV